MTTDPDPTIPELLQRVRSAGVELVAMHPDRILFDGPVEALEAPVVEALRARAPEVVRHLNGAGSPREKRARAPRPPAPSRDADRDLRAELEDDDGEYPPAWRPEVGEILVGELRRYDESTTPYGRAVIAQVANEETGELVSVWLLHHVLLDEFRKLKPKPGEAVGIKRLPDAEHYRRFLVRVDRPVEEAVPDLLQVGAQEGLPGAQPPREAAGGVGPAPPVSAPTPPVEELAEPDDDLPF